MVSTVYLNKIDLIQALKDANNLSKSESEKIVNLFSDKMSNALALWDRVEIRGLFSIFVKKYGGYTGRNPCSHSRQHLVAHPQ